MNPIIIFAAMQLSTCEIPINMGSPNVGAILEFRVGDFISYQEVTDTSSNGAISTRWYMAPEANAPAGLRRGYEITRRNLYGILHYETVSRSLLAVDPAELSNSISQMIPGDVIEFAVPYSSQGRAEEFYELASIRIKFEGCGSVSTVLGQFEVLNFEVRRPHRVGRGNSAVMRESTTNYAYAPSVGWPVIISDSAGDLVLTAIH